MQAGTVGRWEKEEEAAILSLSQYICIFTREGRMITVLIRPASGCEQATLLFPILPPGGYGGGGVTQALAPQRPRLAQFIKTRI